MDKILIRGGKPLQGQVHVRGAKNAALPLMAAALLAEAPCTLHNIPCLHDIFSMDKLLAGMGVKIEFTGRYMTLDAESGVTPVAPYDLVRKMRASFFVLGAAARPLWESEGLAARGLCDWRTPGSIFISRASRRSGPRYA